MASQYIHPSPDVSSEWWISIDKHKHNVPLHPSKECVNSMLLYSLKHIISAFNAQHYQKVASIGQREDYTAQLSDIGASYHGKFLPCKEWLQSSNNIDLYYAESYRDDGINVGLSTYEEVKNLLKALNSLLPKINFTLDMCSGGLSCTFWMATVYNSEVF